MAHPKISCIVNILLITSIFAITSCGPSNQKRNPPLQEDSLFERYTVPSKNAILNQEHYFNFNATTSVGSKLANLGIRQITAPPFFAYPFSADLHLFGKQVKVDNYKWLPMHSVFYGIPTESIASEMKVIPLKAARGSLISLELTNNGTELRTVPLEWSFDGKPGKTDDWEWSPSKALQTSENTVVFQDSSKGFEMTLDSTSMAVSMAGLDFKSEESKLSGIASLKPKESITITIVILLGDKGDVFVEDAHQIAKNPNFHIEANRKYWVDEITEIETKAPVLTGASLELSNYYYKGLMTLISTRWEVPEFLFDPYYSTSGLDGGALNCYLWDISYPSQMVSMLEPEIVKNIIRQFIKTDLREHYAFNPATGEGMGVLYSYNYYNLARLTHDYVTMTGDVDFLKEKVNGSTVIDYLYDFCLSVENLGKPPQLIDYGNNHNLLELKKTESYTHYTASPNSERILTFKLLTDMFGWLNKKTPHNLLQRGQQLKAVFREKLWDKDSQWLRGLDASKQPQNAYSIQIFDVLRSGIMSRKEEKGIVGHLNEEEFLSPWGVYSLSPIDPGYDPNDVDWGGPGVFAGDAPELVIDLLDAGYVDKGIDVLKRILWWGDMPYYPQAIRANAKGYRENGRPNVIAGLTASQSIVTGLFGLKIALDKISITPVDHEIMRGLGLKDIKIRNRVFSVTVSDDGKTFNIVENGTKTSYPIGKEAVLYLVDRGI